MMALALLLGAGGTAEAKIAPDALVRDTADEVLAIIRAQPENSSETAALVEAKVLGHFDFVSMTKLAVGEYWRRADSTQQACLAAEFQTLLVRTYTVALDEFRDARIDYRDAEIAADGSRAVVRTVVARSAGKPVHMDYRMLASGEDWRVYDVLVDGVSLVVNYRSLFGTTVEKSGIDGLIKLLKDKNAAGDSK